MFKPSILLKAMTFALLIALVLASLPMANAVAKGTNEGLEKKWDQLVSNFNTQSAHHTKVHKWVDHWLKTHKKASVSEKAELDKHVSICNSAIMSAGVIVAKHAGFDANGKVVDRAAAIKSIKDLGYYLRQHAGSVKNLNEHMQ